MQQPTISTPNWRERPLDVQTLFERLLALAALVLLIAFFTSAMAGTDTTFTAAVTTITNWSTGSLGKLAAVAGIGSALIGLVLKFDWRLIAGAAGIGLTAATGPGIVSALATATF